MSKRMNEDFEGYVAGDQYCVDTQGTGVGQIVSAEGQKWLGYHPSYPGKQPLYAVMKEAGREPSVNLSIAGNGHALNHKFGFVVRSNTTNTGIIMDSVVKLAPGNGSRIRLGYDGSRWYVYFCLPLGGVTPSCEYSYFKPLDNGYHAFGMAIRHNTVVGYFDDEATNSFKIPYVVDKAWATPKEMFWNVMLYSSPAFNVQYSFADFGIANNAKE